MCRAATEGLFFSHLAVCSLLIDCAYLTPYLALPLTFLPCPLHQKEKLLALVKDLLDSKHLCVNTEYAKADLFRDLRGSMYPNTRGGQTSFWNAMGEARKDVPRRREGGRKYYVKLTRKGLPLPVQKEVTPLCTVCRTPAAVPKKKGGWFLKCADCAAKVHSRKKRSLQRKVSPSPNSS
jgi:hypothetical protein